jgi:hypothetical protein
VSGYRQRVAGRCPACGSESLFLTDGGTVECSSLECPHTLRLQNMLEDRSPVQHVVHVENGVVKAWRPPQEQQQVSRPDRIPADGTYQVTRIGGSLWIWYRLDKESNW